MRHYLFLVFSLAVAGILIYLASVRPFPEAGDQADLAATGSPGVIIVAEEDSEISEFNEEEIISGGGVEVVIELPPAVNEIPEVSQPVSQFQEVRERDMSIEAVVLVRCLLQTQFYSVSSQPWNEQQYNIGSGVVVSPEGYILTARHILDPRGEMLNDPAGRVWERKYCEAALTDENQDEIPMSANDLFTRAEIAYRPSEEQYKDSAGLDFAVLKISSGRPLSYSPIFPKLVSAPEGVPVVAIGYPGREVASPQKLERFDAQLSGITYYEESSCDGTIMPCGIRYFLKRYPHEYEKDFWKSTELGIITPYFRGGFSGAPVFYKGNLIGVVTHGRSGSFTETGWDEAFALASYDIFETWIPLSLEN